MNGVQTRFKCKLDVKRCKRFVFPPSSLLPRSNALKTKAIRYFQTDRTLTRIVSPPLRSTVHEGTVVGLLCDLESIIANYLADGYNVKLGELGTFSATLTCRKVTDKSEIRAASVHFDNIKFKPTRKFRKEVRSKGKLERAEYGFRTSSTRYSAEERFVRLTNYLKEHSIITCKEYCALTGLLKTKAGSELRQWSSEKKIERNGRAPHVIYRAMPEG